MDCAILQRPPTMVVCPTNNNCGERVTVPFSGMRPCSCVCNVVRVAAVLVCVLLQAPESGAVGLRPWTYGEDRLCFL